ncbi:uncharacterized protein (DUF2126 family)/transglutaminase-like putative cysteine protease [Rubricella aquisinus]|uniref:Uncharacterized protein (DUF2126 family)/transglutaminase-like putative cysteine protease n=1 Tax=Rubricella aquisinus TaxID=2028108 RepID=A0A840WWL9_9RHOB|nr:transglutaminase family protein [Rubricella aquisinus]MBB5514704.1 uncharacterized protein (DUF2126 family)/transglutaminase-like putative cysteine protease [Rubricella aquisinus]
MSIKVAITHRTSYKYDKPITLAPHVVRLRPAPHARTPITSYSFRVSPADHFINWQQDAFANWQARLVFPEKTDHLTVEVDVIADLIAINPFEFFLEDSAQQVPFTYDAITKHDLAPYLVKHKGYKAFSSYLESAPKPDGQDTIPWLVALNSYVQQTINYTVRMEPGVQTPEETIGRALGSCRDSGWLLVNMLREFGYAARFVSGYLVQLKSDMQAVDGPSGPAEDFTDLHAWAEVYLPGAGWVGMDPTSGLFAGEGHIPLACTPEPSTAAAITGAHEPAEVEFDFEMKVERIEEPPRVTLPVTASQWKAIDRAGQAVDKKLKEGDVRLTMGGEPTFIAEYDRDAPEWTTAAVGPTKRAYADKLIRRLRDRFAPEGVLHYGQGKWYPGEQLPRWAFSLTWRGDGQPLWSNPDLITKEGEGKATHEDAGAFMAKLCDALEIDPDHAHPLYEDPAEFLKREADLPANVTPEDSKLSDPQERARLARVFDHGFENPVAYVLPIQLAQARAKGRRFRWQSDKWKTRREKLFLIPGDSPAGFRLPLGSLKHLREAPRPFQRDPMARTGPLRQTREATGVFGPGEATYTDQPSDDWLEANAIFLEEDAPVRTALSVESRDGTLCVFLPPTGSIEEYEDLVAAVEETAEALDQPVHIEGYEPPRDPRVNIIRVTPDPGVIEVNIHPAHDWDGLKAITDALYEEARQCHLDSSTFMVDGRPTGSGGGNHIVVGGETPGDSPFLRRPHLLGSIIRYWQRHPSLSYLFSGMFIGPTSQAPRIDEARHDSLYEMEIALKELDRLGDTPPHWLVDRLFRHMMVDVTGNTHRAEICIDKMFSPDGPTGRLGLVEFRGFEMPPHWHMSMAQSLVIRALIAWFWDTPYKAPLKPMGTHLHDTYLLPDYVWSDFGEVMDDLSRAHGFPFDIEWFRAQYDFRFPVAGKTKVEGMELELRSAIEPWNVLGEESTAGGTARFVDSSVERVQVKLTDFDPTRYTLCCNGYAVPLQARADGSHVAGIRYRSWQPWSALHPTIPAHGPLRLELFDIAAGRPVGGCTYHSAHPGGRSHETRPVNALEAEGRRIARFSPGGQSPDLRQPTYAGVHPAFPKTLDLRRL